MEFRKSEGCGERGHEPHERLRNTALQTAHASLQYFTHDIDLTAGKEMSSFRAWGNKNTRTTYSGHTVNFLKVDVLDYNEITSS
jgi:hypothetical protein